MKKLGLLSILLVSLFLGARAQNYAADRAAIHLKSGAIVRGAIVMEIPRESITITTDDGNTLTYYDKDIRWISRSRSPQAGSGNSDAATAPGSASASTAVTSTAPKATRFSARPAGYTGILEVNYGIGIASGTSGWDRIQATYVFGGTINPYLYAGVGTGLNYYSISISYFYGSIARRFYSIPLYAHLRANMLDKDVTPFFALSAGYNISLDGPGGGFKGLIMEPSAGVSFRVSDRESLYLGIGYALSELRSDGYSEGKLENLTFKLGFTF